jgi:membrane fusion protein, multidrug efflux system
MRYYGLTAAVFGFVVLVIGGLGLIKYRQVSAAGGGPPNFPTAVTMTPAQQRTFTPTISTTGTVVARQWVTLRNESQGKVVNVNLEPGQIVEAGELLLELDTAVEQAELRAAEARLRLAQVNEERVKKSVERNVSTVTEVDQSRANTEAAAAEVQRFQAIIARKQIKAPFKGVVGLSDIHLGQFLAEGAEITTLQGMDDEVYVEFAMPEAMAARMPLGTPVTLELGDQPVVATLHSYDALVNPGTRSKRTRVIVGKGNDVLRPGQSVTVRLPADLPRQVVVVPANAIRRSAWGDFIYLVGKNDKDQPVAKKTSITVGTSLGEWVIVDQGVLAGQEVVADGSFKLMDGMWLMPTPMQTSTTQPSTTQP